MAIRDKKTVVMEHDRAVPGGVATLNEEGKLAEEQRPAYSAGQIVGLDETLESLTGCLDKLTKDGADCKPLTGPGDPDGSTKGAVGQHYLNTTTGKEYTCVAADGEAGVYTWKESGGGGGGSIITITFDAEFAGQTFTVSDGSDTVTGTVPEELAVSVNVLNIDSKYIVTSSADGVEYSTTVTTGPYFGRYAAALIYPHIYGVRWSGGPETTMSRTDGAEDFLEPEPFVNDGAHPGRSPFDDIMPWAGMKIVDDPDLGQLVSIPKYWYKWTKSGAVMTLQISDKKADGFFVSPAHADRGDGSGERDMVYVGRFHCGSTAYKSVSGQLPKGDVTRATARSAIHALNTTAWQYDFAMHWTIMMLYLVEFADWNVQKTIGYGCGNNSAVQACGASDSMGYHTGTMQSSRSTYGVGCQYRYIEGLWENIQFWVDGIYFRGVNVYCVKNPSSFSDTGNGTLIGTRPIASTIASFIKAWSIPADSEFGWALYPSELGGSDSTYVPDAYFYFDTGLLRAGYLYTHSQGAGLFVFLVPWKITPNARTSAAVS